jgi:hypothetical protein
MGSLFRYRCPACKYKAEVAGESDSGFFASTVTICCSNCKKLYDVVVSQCKPNAQTELEEWEDVQPRCPRSSKHLWREWRHPGQCPKCGATMNRPDSPDVLWD